MDILQSIDTNVSSMVSSSFDEFISTKVKEAVEKEKEKFLTDLNMCEEEYPVYQPSNELTEENINLLKVSLELGWKMVNKEHRDFNNILSHAKSKLGDGGEFDENNFKEEYEKTYYKMLNYYKTLTYYPQKIIDDNEFLIHFHGSKRAAVNDRDLISDSYGYGITNKGIIYQNIRKASPYYLFNSRASDEKVTSSKDFAIELCREKLQDRDIIRKFQHNMYPDTRNGPNKQQVIIQPNDKFKEEISRNRHTPSSNFHLYDISKYIKQCENSLTCRPAHDYNSSNNSNCIDGRYYEGTGCRRGRFLVKHVKKVECEEEDPMEKNVKGKKGEKHTKGANYPHIKKIKEEIEYKVEGNSKEDSIRRFLEDDICPDCGAGELLYSIEDIGFDPRVINKYPLNKEYIDILHLIKPDNLEMIFSIQTIYAKYHPRANENFVIEEKIKKLSQIEMVVEEKVEEKKNELEKQKHELEKQKEIYSEKIKQVNEEKLKRIFSMFILRNERKENIKDKNTIREMIKRSNDKCKKKEQEQKTTLEKQRNEFEKEKEKFYEEKNEYENTFKSKVKSLLDMANDINEINELQDDTLCKSDELFNLMKRLNEFI